MIQPRYSHCWFSMMNLWSSYLIWHSGSSFEPTKWVAQVLNQRSIHNYEHADLRRNYTVQIIFVTDHWSIINHLSLLPSEHCCFSYYIFDWPIIWHSHLSNQLKQVLESHPILFREVIILIMSLIGSKNYKVFYLTNRLSVPLGLCPSTTITLL